MLGLAGSVLTTIYSDWVHQHQWMVYVGWGCCLGSFAFLGAAIVQWRKVHVRFIIHQALWYGDNENAAQEKTDHVDSWRRPDNTIYHYVHEYELGPQPLGQAKRLRVRYSLGKIKNRMITVVNGGVLIIPEPSSLVET
jgi:hypothetical protein